MILLFLILQSVLSLRAHVQEFARFEKKHHPWSGLTKKTPRPLNYLSLLEKLMEDLGFISLTLPILILILIRSKNICRESKIGLTFEAGELIHFTGTSNMR